MARTTRRENELRLVTAMSATRRDVGGAVRLANLGGVLGWHAIVGVACLARGRRGFEAVTPEVVRWGVAIMLAASVIVMAELVFRRRGPNPVARLGWALALAFGVTAALGWGWVFWGSFGYGYDALAALFSRGVGASYDAETGSGFAGVPVWALVGAAGLGAWAWTSVEYATGYLVARQTGASSSGASSYESSPAQFKRSALVQALPWIGAALALLGLGGLLHLSNGVLLGL